MLPFSDGQHNVYGPDTLEVMCAAYDPAVQLLPPNLQDHERARRRLARSGTCRQQWMSAQVGCQVGTQRGVSTHLEFPGGVHHPLMGCVSTLRQSADGAA